MLKLENIRKTINSNVILKDFNLELRSGEIASLTGESGSGKSTVLQILGLLTSVDGGEIFIGERNCTRFSSKERNGTRRKIGFIHQFHHLLPEFTVMENLIIPQLISGTNSEQAFIKAKELLSKFSLYNFAKRKPSELSGGQSQRIAILRAFINNPILILADEPTGNLDKENAEEIFRFILDNSRENKITSLIVTHNYELAQKTDRIIKMEEAFDNEKNSSYNHNTHIME